MNSNIFGWLLGSEPIDRPIGWMLGKRPVGSFRMGFVSLEEVHVSDRIPATP
jgi:hypothetical protein